MTRYADTQKIRKQVCDQLLLRQGLDAIGKLATIDRQPLSLIEIRPAGNAVLLRMQRESGAITTLRVSTLDAPACELLNDLDRARVRAALLALHRQRGGPVNVA